MADTTGLRIVERPVVEAPALVVMLSGWIDASGAAAAAMQQVEQDSGAITFATFDPDLFIDYRARRPVMELRDGVSTRLVWPTIELKVGRDLDGHDLLLLTGHEPDSNWQRFSELVTTICGDLGVRIAVGLGAYPFGSPHTRTARLSCTTPSVDLARRVTYLRNSVDVPAGAAAVLEQAFHARGVPAIGLWAQVPHYIATMTYPGASVALLDGLGELAGLRFEIEDLRRQAIVQRQRLDELVAANPEHVAMLHQLEAAYDDMVAQTVEAVPGLADVDPADLPTGDELAAEVEQFLRDQES
jgi:hypothetical protein